MFWCKLSIVRVLSVCVRTVFEFVASNGTKHPQKYIQWEECGLQRERLARHKHTGTILPRQHPHVSQLIVMSPE